MLTGESKPVAKQVETVIGGAINGEGYRLH
jgi:cation transport ATPase